MQKTNKDTNKAACLLLSRWFILSMMMVFLVSCAGMRPPGYHANNHLSEKEASGNKDRNSESNKKQNVQKQNNSKNEFDLSSIEKFEQKVAQKNDNLKIVKKAADKNSPQSAKRTSKNEKITKGIMPLEKQISLLSEDQKKISDDIDEVKTDISRINNRLSKIEKMLKKEKSNNEKQSSKKAMPVKHQKEEAKQQKKNDEFIIYPDDHDNKQKEQNTQKPQKPKKPVIKKVSAEKPEKQTRLFENAINKFNGKNYKRAIDLLTQINNNHNIQNSANYYIGRSYFEMKNYKKAVQHFEDVLNSNKNSYKPDAKYMIAESHINMGQVNKAKEIYQEFMAEFPANKWTPKVRKMLQKL